MNAMPISMSRRPKEQACDYVFLHTELIATDL